MARKKSEKTEQNLRDFEELVQNSLKEELFDDGSKEKIVEIPVKITPTLEKITVVQPAIPTWEQVRNQLHSVSAMKRDLTGERITHGDAIAIFKTDAHRKLYHEWVAHKKSQV